jgi:hypothetical protein
MLDEEEERRKQRRRKKGRIRELEEIRAELAEKELVLLSKEQELLEKEQTVNVLREEVCCLHYPASPLLMSAATLTLGQTPRNGSSHLLTSRPLLWLGAGHSNSTELMAT